VTAGWPIPAERREKVRYPLGLSVRFRSCLSDSAFSGQGLAINMSSSGILVASQQHVVEGALVEMSIEWPFVLNGRIPLQLTANGRILRRGPSRFAASIERYEFRTVKISNLSQKKSQRYRWPPN